MRRFWWVVVGGAGVVTGILAGAILMYLTVIVPRSGELSRFRGASGFLDSLSVEGMLGQADPGRSWTVKESRLSQPWQLNGQELLWGRIVFAEADVPEAEQAQVLAAVQAQAIAALNVHGGYLHSLSSESSSSDGVTASRNSAGYTLPDRTGTWELVGRGQGNRLLLIMLIQER